MADSIQAQAAAAEGGRERLLTPFQLPELGMLLPPRPCGEWEPWAAGRERAEKEKWSLV